MRAALWLKDVFAAMHPPITCPGSFTGEDAILRKLLPDDPVVYVDVGAAEPVQCSNTWQFYQAGGRGLLIEPLPEWWGPLLRHRPLDRLWPTAASDRQGGSRLRMCQAGSSLDPEWRIKELGTTAIETMRLKDILQVFPEIRDSCQFCDVDVEGHEREVLSGIDWGTFRPNVYCVEYPLYHPDHQGESTEDKWAHILLDNGYREVTRTPGNIIYVEEKLEDWARCMLENA